MDVFYLAMAAVTGMLLASVTIYQMSKPRVGVWKCRRCLVAFEAVEGGNCPHCNTRSPHHWLGKDWPP